MKTFTFIAVLLIVLTACSQTKVNNSATDQDTLQKVLPRDSDSSLDADSVYFIATGTEPFWGLEISKNQIILNLIEDSIITKTPIPKEMDNNGEKKFLLDNDSLKMEITLLKQECTNGMSGAVSSQTVKVSYKRKQNNEGRLLEGCGRYSDEELVQP